MKRVSIFNEVLGPVMHGPSSSHTAASFNLAAVARSLLGDKAVEAEFTFDPDGSYGKVYREQGSDLAFAAALLGWTITDERFEKALELAQSAGIDLRFAVRPLPEADHPNTVRIFLKGQSGRFLHAVGSSIGGGSIEITSLEGWPVLLNGKSHEVAVAVRSSAEGEASRLLQEDGEVLEVLAPQARQESKLLLVRRRASLSEGIQQKLEKLPGVERVWAGIPICFVKTGTPLFASASEMVALAEKENLSCGKLALKYEATLLGRPESECIDEMLRRFEVMREAAHAGLAPGRPPMQLLRPTAGRVYEAEQAGTLAIGGLHTRAAARAMAAMHVNCGMGVVCAAPTAGSAGVLPGVMTTLREEKGISDEQTALALFAAGLVGVFVAERATFAAEVAGCQVEIGAAGAMAAAAVVDFAGGTARQAADAAAISFQNTMGSVCDLVHGIVEIPCHTRNAVAASSAFVCADLILGGYDNPIPLDETIDAVYAVGKVLPPELKVTSLGGLAVTPSAQGMKRLK